MKVKLVIGIALILIIVSIDLIHHQHILPQFFIAPDGHTIAYQFAQAVVSGDADLALDLTDGSLACEENMRQTLEKYSIYEGSEIESIVANAYQFLDAPHEGFVDVLVTFERVSDLEGFTARLKTDHTVIGKRFTCGVALPET